jgi:hypothetical protein
MATWKIELVTNGVVSNQIEIEADKIVKADYQTLIIDGCKWELPVCELGLSFAMVEVDA